MGKRIIIGVVAVCCVALVVVGVMRFPRARRHDHALSSCINNLRLIDSAKQQWALETGITNRAPTWDELTPFIGRGDNGTKPVCPQGGTYSIGETITLPTCSIGGWHVLKP